MKFKLWWESAMPLQQRTRMMSGTFYHLTNEQSARMILQGGFSLNYMGKGWGFIDLGEPNGISLFLTKEEARKFHDPAKVLLRVEVSPVKTLDARGIDRGPWVQHDGGWPEFIGHFFNIEGEEVFSREFVTNLLLKNGFGAVLHSTEIRLLELTHIVSVSKDGYEV